MVFPISGFTAVPNPVMLSFMGAQSFIMMYMAGEAWQYGKRKISAMTNEEFNKLTPIELLKNQQSTLKEAIPSMEKSMEDMTPMFKTITAEMLKAIPPVVEAIGETVPDVISSILNPQESGKTISPPGPQLLNPQAISIGAQNAQSIGTAVKQILDAILAGISGTQLGLVGKTLTGTTETQLGTSAKIEEAKRLAQIAINKDKADKAMQDFLIKQQGSQIDLPKNIDIHQQATQEFKPKAGQTQLIARKGLIKKILGISLAIKKWKSFVVRNQADRNKKKLMLQRNEVLMAQSQTVLTGLINRYRW